jgi:hypothetical protein
MLSNIRAKYSSLTPSICLLFNKTKTNTNDSEFAQVFRGLLYNRLEYYNQKYDLLDDKQLTTASVPNFRIRIGSNVSDKSVSPKNPIRNPILSRPNWIG